MMGFAATADGMLYMFGGYLACTYQRFAVASNERLFRECALIRQLVRGQ